jgi:hypothetical protein
MDMDITTGGDSGAETVTWSTLGDYIYLFFVDEYAHSGDTTLVESGARVAFYGRDGNGDPLVIREEVDTNDPNSRSRLLQYIFYNTQPWKVLAGWLP